MTWDEIKATGYKERAEVLGRIHETTVEGQKYLFWSDDVLRGTFAQSEAGEIKRIYSNGYITKDLTVRKAIANRFGRKSFRK